MDCVFGFPSPPPAGCPATLFACTPAGASRTNSAAPPHQLQSPNKTSDDQAATIDRIPDPAIPEFGAEWDAAFEKRSSPSPSSVLTTAKFQIFDLNVLKERPAAEVANTLGITMARVYFTKHRISATLKKELARLENQSSDRLPSIPTNQEPQLFFTASQPIGLGSSASGRGRAVYRRIDR